MKNDKVRPKVGIGVMILKRGKVLMGLRANNHGAGTWCFAGGNLELGESFAACAKREIMEECGVRVKNIRFQCVANIKKYGSHYAMIGFAADWQTGEPKLLE